ncbi:MAG: YdcF family protein [Lachnospiraceae bacterium]|nr:YdcF family protein [Lachnospiraceae bacterium]
MNIQKRILSGFLFFSGLAGAIWFLLPFFTWRIVNIGNLTGLLFCVLLMAYAIFMKKVHSAVKRLRKRPAGKYLLNAALLIAVIIGGLVITETACMITAAKKTPAPNATVVLLGCKVNGEHPSLMLLKRLEATWEYMEENPDSVCVVSGGQGPDENISEAECMYRYLTQKGIAPERLYKEDRSTSTRENLAFSKEIIEAHQLNPEIAIATNEFHEYRAGKIADALGFTHSSVPGKTPWYLFATYYVRELYGILYEWIF